jgi:hypothetical protein
MKVHHIDASLRVSRAISFAALNVTFNLLIS